MKAVSIHFLLLAVILATGACRKRTDVPPSGDETASTQQDALSGSDTTTPVGEGPADTPGSRAAIAESLGTSNPAYEAWFKKHRLDLNDPAMLDADPDADGATNRDEFMADTNPRDPNSRPGVHAFIRLQEYREVKVPLVLEAIEGETARIKHLGDGESRTETVRAGQTIHGMKVARMLVRKETDKNGDPVDLSRVELEDPSSKEHVLLVKDMPAKSPASHAILTSADRQTTVTVRQGEVFEWPGNRGARYKVVDLREDQAVVQEVATKKMFTIPRQ